MIMLVRKSAHKYFFQYHVAQLHIIPFEPLPTCALYYLGNVTVMSDPGMDAGGPVQQPASVPGSGEGLDAEEEAKLSQEGTEHCCCNNNERRHHYETQDDQSRAAVVIQVLADGGTGIKDS